ncbi:PaaI family thioesterase [bacterium]|nr:PaaI family thioesterase [bacterium]
MENFFELPEFPGCFVCGRDNPGGLKLRFYSDGSTVRAEFIPSAVFSGYGNIVHGGIVSAVLDEAIVWAAYVSGKRFGVTAEINVRFLKPVTIEKMCIVSGRVTESKKRICICEASLTDKDGTVFAKASGRILLMKQKESDELKSKLYLERQ